MCSREWELLLRPHIINKSFKSHAVCCAVVFSLKQLLLILIIYVAYYLNPFFKNEEKSAKLEKSTFMSTNAILNDMSSSCGHINIGLSSKIMPFSPHKGAVWTKIFAFQNI